MSKASDWWFKHAPYPLWASCNNPFWSPWCWIDDICHMLFPITFGWDRCLSNDIYVGQWPDKRPWICRKHDAARDKYLLCKHPEWADE